MNETDADTERRSDVDLLAGFFPGVDRDAIDRIVAATYRHLNALAHGSEALPVYCGLATP
jgi:hypothetical protein